MLAEVERVEHLPSGPSKLLRVSRFLRSQRNDYIFIANSVTQDRFRFRCILQCSGPRPNENKLSCLSASAPPTSARTPPVLLLSHPHATVGQAGRLSTFPSSPPQEPRVLAFAYRPTSSGRPPCLASPHARLCSSLQHPFDASCAILPGEWRDSEARFVSCDTVPSLPRNCTIAKRVRSSP